MPKELQWALAALDSPEAETPSRIGLEYRAFNGHLMIYQDEDFTYNATHSGNCKCSGESLPDW